MPEDAVDGMSTLVQVMAWCRQATNHYLSKCWSISMSPLGHNELMSSLHGVLFCLAPTQQPDKAAKITKHTIAINSKNADASRCSDKDLASDIYIVVATDNSHLAAGIHIWIWSSTGYTPAEFVDERDFVYTKKCTGKHCQAIVTICREYRSFQYF